MKRISVFLSIYTVLLFSALGQEQQNSTFQIDNEGYLKRRGANVMLAHDFYPESHQGGVGIIQNGIRVATNGDLRLETAPGQWQPVPKVGERTIYREDNRVSVEMAYPDDSKDRKGFNPILYPDLQMEYTVSIEPAGESFYIIVDLKEPLPAEWIGQVGMNIELFPGILFGKSYAIDSNSGIFTRQANGPGYYNAQKVYELKPMGEGKRLVIAPESTTQRLTIENEGEGDLLLVDGRAQHSNGWFIVRSLVPANATEEAIKWKVTPHVMENYRYEPVVQISQVGYHPNQPKIAVIERDEWDQRSIQAELVKIEADGTLRKVLSKEPADWGKFLRYHYQQFDFSAVKEEGMYQIRFGDYVTEPFQISAEVYDRHVWQPTLEYFLPVQMCHMLVQDRYKIWHGRCHLDDALMAPTNHNHFDGYIQGESTLTTFESGEHVPGLHVGAWHDAGDFDIRIESQAATIQGLSQIYELFQVEYDNTTIDQSTQTVHVLQPDGKSDMLQQIEHGALSIVGGYEALGRFYRGIIVPTLPQYRLLGDPVNHSDGIPFSVAKGDTTIPIGQKGAPDDRWVFTEKNKSRSLAAAAALATTHRALRGYNDELSNKCLKIAEEVWRKEQSDYHPQQVALAVALWKSTRKRAYKTYLISHAEAIAADFDQTGYLVGPILSDLSSKRLNRALRKAAKAYVVELEEMKRKNPYGIPYEPNIWGAGWGIQHFGMKLYFLHKSFPDLFSESYVMNSLNFILGVHPGVNTSSFASGVGARSLTQAYGINRGDFHYTPGGIGSGTALIRPDFPELLEWPFLWQQTEYVLGGGTTDYLLLVLAVNHLLKNSTTDN